MIFLSPRYTIASNYGYGSNENIVRYKLNLKNPLIIRASTEPQAVRMAYERLHPEKKIKGGITSENWQKLDRANSVALKKE